MELTQQDYDDRRARIDDGTADDEDRRLVKHYMLEGYGADDSAPVRNPFELGDAGNERADGEALGDDTDAAPDYAKMTKRELVTELEQRRDADGNPLVFDRTARNESLIEQLQANDRMRAEQSQD